MTEPMLPTAACAEMFLGVPGSTKFSIGAAVVKGAVDERRRELGTIRYCARKALHKLGAPAVPILPDVDGAPRWPVGLVGRMTRCAGYRAAVVARCHDLCGVGIDGEPHAAVPDAVLDLILRDEERARPSALAGARPGLRGDRIVFCVKEAARKAWFPLTRRWLDFADVSVREHLDGSFRARVRVPGARAAGVDLERFIGQWVVIRSLVVAVTSISRAQAARTPTLAGAT